MKKFDSTILILGAGQVGIEVAIQCIRDGFGRIILHCLTAEESANAVKVVRDVTSATSIETSFGNILLPLELAMQPKITEGSDAERQQLNYLYGPLTSELIGSSLLYHLVDRFRPAFIVDAVNTATVVGYRQGLYERVRHALANDAPSITDINAIAQSMPVPPLVRFVQVLQRAMKTFKVERYVKVSTTGLGGMGFNIMYTHGDLGEPGLSTNLLGKISAAGILHQLLWTLRHTPGFKVNLVVPAALIGWGEITQRSIVPIGRPLVDCNPILVKDFPPDEPLEKLAQISILNGKTIDCPVVASGENGDYSFHDMASITAPGQMGCITKEEVASAVLEVLNGDESHCLLAAMDQVQLRESVLGYNQRHKLLDAMQRLVDSSGVPSPSVLNLGPRVAKLLWELEIISRVCSTLREAVELADVELSVRCQRFIGNSEIHREMLLSLNFPIITDDLVFLPNCEPVTLADLYGRADKQCVDLRRSTVARWQVAFRLVVDSIDRNEAPPFSNFQDVSPDGPIKSGELLGYWFTISGGGKKIEA